MRTIRACVQFQDRHRKTLTTERDRSARSVLRHRAAAFVYISTYPRGYCEATSFSTFLQL